MWYYNHDYLYSILYVSNTCVFLKYPLSVLVATHSGGLFMISMHDATGWAVPLTYAFIMHMLCLLIALPVFKLLIMGILMLCSSSSGSPL